VAQAREAFGSDPREHVAYARRGPRAERNVMGQGAGNHGRILGDPREWTTHGADALVAEIARAITNGPEACRLEPEQCADQRRLPRTGGPPHRDDLARPRLERRCHRIGKITQNSDLFDDQPFARPPVLWAGAPLRGVRPTRFAIPSGVLR